MENVAEETKLLYQNFKERATILFYHSTAGATMDDCKKLADLIDFEKSPAPPIRMYDDDDDDNFDYRLIEWLIQVKMK